MIFFLSKEGRRIFNLVEANENNQIAVRLACDTLAMNRSMLNIEADLKGKSVIEVAQLNPTMADAPKIRLVDYLGGYRFMTEEFVARDYTRIDLLKLVSIIFRHDLGVIKKIANSVKSRKNFSISYLSAILESDGAVALEEIRREARMEELARETARPVLPDVRPVDIVKSLETLAEERRIDDTLKGTF